MRTIQQKIVHHKPSFKFDIENKTIKTNLIVDYVGGSLR